MVSHQSSLNNKYLIVLFLLLLGQFGRANRPFDQLQGSFGQRAFSTLSIRLDRMAVAMMPPSCSFLSNPDFESGLSSWITGSSVSTTSDSHSGTYGANLTGSNSYVYQSKTGITPGRVYDLSFWGKIENGPSSAVVVIRFKNSSNNVLNVTTIDVTSTYYAAYYASATAPTGAYYIDVYAFKSGSSGRLKVDDFCVQETIPTIGSCILAQNTGFENGMNNWSISGGSISNSTDAHSGTSAAEFVSNSTTLTQRLAIQPSQTYELTVWAKVTTSAPSYAEVFLDWVDYNGNVIHSIIQPILSNVTEYKQFTLTGTAPSNAAYAEIGGYKSGSTSRRLYVDDFCLSLANSLGGTNFPLGCGCSDNMLPNGGFEELNTSSFPYTLDGKSVAAISNNNSSTAAPWRTQSNKYSFIVKDIPATVNNPEGDYFLWLPQNGDGWFSIVDFTDNLKMEDGEDYTLCFYAASWAGSLNSSGLPDGGTDPQLPTVVDLGITFSSGYTTVEKWSVPASASMNNLSWKKYTYTFTYSSLNPISNFSISNSRNNVGVAVDAVNLSKVNCETEVSCGPGGITYQRWTGIGGSNMYDLMTNPNFPNNYNETGMLYSFQGPANIDDNYGTRVLGYLQPSITGNYTFNVTSDDNSRLYLSSNSSPLNKSVIAYVPGWTNITEYTKYTQQTSSSIYLTAGTKYYIELVQKEGGGLDHFQVQWKTPSNSSWNIIPGANLAPICHPEVCNNGLDDDFDGLTDCDDPDCSDGLTASYVVTNENCGSGGGAIDLTSLSLDLPLSYVWSDMVPTAWWTFEENLNDVSGNDHHSNGTSGSFIYSKDAIEGNYSIYFNGSSYVRYSVDNGFMEQPFTKLSLSMWLKPENLSGVKTVFDEGGSTSGKGIAMRFSNNTLVTRVRESGFIEVSSTFPSDGNWHHVAAVFDSGDLTMYIDGVPSSTSNTSSFTTVSNHGNNGGVGSSIGGSVLNSSGTFYKGQMDDIRYYHEIGLNADQVADLARNDGDRTNLFAGAYTVTVTSAAGCSNSQTIDVNSIANHTNGGTIVGDEASCSGTFDPSLITSSAPASGGSAGTTEYQWQSSTDGGVNWADIAGANSSTYDPTSISTATQYRRAGRRSPCLAWVYSNVITKTIIVNYTSPGTILGDEMNCGGYDPSNIFSITVPTGGAGGTLAYQWQSSTDSITWSDIAGATSASFNPTSITQTTYYRRGARRSPCTINIYSATVTKMVVVNYTDPGIIAGAESSCSSFDPDIISSVIVPSGGIGGSLEYQWQYSTDYGASWLNIPAATAETYNPITIIQTTYYRRAARRSPCTAFIYSNPIIKMVVVNFNAGGVISGDQGTCGNYDPFLISNAAYPSGGIDGTFTYQWQQSIDGGTTWVTIPGEFDETLDPATISTTTLFRRQSRRSPCSTWINSNTVTKTVLASPDFTIATHPDNVSYICEWTPCVFEATDMGAGATYAWDFGPYAMPSSATGIGPHVVTFNVPNGAFSTPSTVTLSGSVGGCDDMDSISFNIRPQISVTGTSLVHPEDCEVNNGEIFINTSHPALTNVQASIDGGTTWDDEPLHFDSLYSGIYQIKLRYDDGDCVYDYGSVTLKDPLDLAAEIHVSQNIGCKDDALIFEAIKTDSLGSIFEWDFGPGATPATAVGLGPHSVTFSNAGTQTVQLFIRENFCTGYVDTMITIVDNYTSGGLIAGNEDLCDIPNTTPTTSVTMPSGGSGGTIEYQWQVSEDDGFGGWTAWTDIAGANGTTYAPGLISASSKFRRGARRMPCGSWVFSNEVLKRLSNLPEPKDDIYTSACPGILFFDYVSLNDINLSNPVYSVETPPINGTIDLDIDGEFVYTPNASFCGTDEFTYRVCNNGTTCCATAKVVIDMSDDEPPALLNIPADVTISCDDEIPLAPIVDASENCHTIILGMDEASNQGTLDSCSIYSYALTRTWTGSDYCGNNASENQVINIQDITSPDIYRIYTMPNSKKMVGGVMENVSQRWKTVRFPVQFSSIPVVFAQIVTKNDPTPVVVRLQNVSTSQFKMRLQEEENEDGIHGLESVAWIAMEKGEVTGTLPYEINTKLVSNSSATISFATPKPTPCFIGTIQSFNEKDPVSLRLTSLSSTQAKVFCEEETSLDPETNHGFETVGYIALSGSGDLKNQAGEIIGETGKINLDSTTITVNLQHQYHNPVVVLGGMTFNGLQPSIIRASNITPNSFKVQIQEWMYLDGYHLIENLSYMVVEGSIPFDREVECSAIPAPPTIGVQIVGMDNCDVSTPLTITDSPFNFNCASDTMFTRTFHVQDECGNFTTMTQVYTLRDTTPPTFSAPADIIVTCLVNLDSLPYLGDVVDESDNCSTGLEATYTDDNSFRNGCSGYVIRNWTLVDNCGNTTTHPQIIIIYNPNDTDGDGLADPFDLDDDNDGIPDVDEGTGDTDGDGIPNAQDLDSDNDGIPDIIEAGFTDANGDGIVDSFGDPDWDIDGDGLANEFDLDDDNTSLAASDGFDPYDSQHDSDGDGIPNFLDLDSDNDGIPDLIEAGGVDTDGDGIIDYPIPGDPGSMEDADGDGFVDTYDPDDNSIFGIDNPGDALITNDNGTYGGNNVGLGPDSDGDGVPDFIDLDSDNDGIVDLIEVGGVDKDGDGRIDSDDFLDTNGNGFHDIYETYALITTDSDGANNDGLPDDDDGDGSAYNSADADHDGIPNQQDTDSDNDGINDVIEIGYGALDLDHDGHIDTIIDTNGDGLNDGSSGTIFTDGDGSVPDGKPQDNADANSTAYGSVLADGTFGENNGQPDLDDDGDGIPNFLDTDSDNDLLLDEIEDSNGNGITDTGETNYLNSDTDGDFISDGTEDANHDGHYDPGVETDPLNEDTDNDGYNDGVEDSNQNGMVDGSESDPRNPCDPIATPACVGVSLSINTRMAGPLIGNTVTPIMSDYLRSKGYLPVKEPYQAMQNFHHVGSQGGLEVVDTSVFNITGPNAIVDWMFIELRNSLDPQQVVATRSALLQRDGDIVDLDGFSYVRFDSMPSGEYYITVRHRNHLGVATLVPRMLSPVPTAVDFSDPSTSTYGMQSQIAINGVNAMWPGDLNSDGQTIYQGPNNDINTLFFTVLLEPLNVNQLANFVVNGYKTSDINMDGQTIYQGPANDRSMLLLNSILKAPSNVNLLTNYIIVQQLP